MVSKTVEAAGENLVDVGLVADVEEDLVLGRVEDGVQREGQLDHAEIGAEMAAGFGESLDEEGADLLRQLGHLRSVQAFQVGGRMNGLQQCSHVLPSPEIGVLGKCVTYWRLAGSPLPCGRVDFKISISSVCIS